MDEIAALTSWERDEWFLGLFSAMRGEPRDEHQTELWNDGYQFYLSCRSESTQTDAALN